MKIYYYNNDSLLHRLNPLSKLLMILPVMAFIALTSDPWTPLVFIGLVMIFVLFFGRIPLSLFLRYAYPPLLFLMAFFCTYPFLVQPELVVDSPILFRLGPFPYYQAALLHGIATLLRAYAIILFSLAFTLTTDVSDFIRAMIQQWKFPYKIGYGSMAAFRFVPMLQSEMHLIKSAHKIRGISNRGRLGYDRLRRYAVPLLGIAIQRAERTALAMDSRAFGALRKRTYYKQYRFRAYDYLFVIGFWLVSLTIALLLLFSGLLGPLSFVKPL